MKENIQKYRELFPKGILPNGKPGRSSIAELEKKFLWFFKNHEFDWETVLKATKMYVTHYELQGYKYMQTASYFISKQNNSKVISSALADWCAEVGNQETESFDINI